jgi:malonyl-CoA O-methyltransferase
MTRVAHRFNRAATSYDANAAIQKELGRKLFSLYGRAHAPHRILELGCGTGLFSEILWRAFPESKILCTDLAPNMLDACQKRLQTLSQTAGAQPITSPSRVDFCLLNGEAPEWNSLPTHLALNGDANSKFRLIASNALVQWFPNLEQHFEKVSAFLASGGDILVSGFGPENLIELSRSLQRIGKPNLKSIGHAPESVQTAIENQGLILKAFHAEEVKQAYAHPMDLFRSLAGLGATVRPGADTLAPKEVRALAEFYRRHYLAPGGKVFATWSTWAAWAIKP